MIRKSISCVLSAILCLFSSMTGIFSDQLETIQSVTKVEDGFYIMDYTYDYDIDEMLRKGTSNHISLIAYGIANTMLGGKGFGCTTFNSVNSKGQYLFSRNFDYMDSGYMLVRTTPKNGYASISSVAMMFMAYTDKLLPIDEFTGLRTLLAPYEPLDGINEKGLSIGVLELEKAPLFQISLKPDLTTTTVIRAVLDKAATVDEAIEIFRSHDIRDFLFGNCTYHYQIADASGKSVVIEYVKGKMNIIYPEKRTKSGVDYLVATNFYLTKGVRDPLGMGQDRLEKVYKALDKAKGVTSEKQAMNILSSVSMDHQDLHGHICSTLWSTVYNTATRSVTLCHHYSYDKSYSFSLSKSLNSQIK